MNKRLRICFIVEWFPALFQTFILNQITGIIDSGHYIEIFAFKKPKNKTIHPDVIKYDLLNKVHYISAPKGKLKRILKAIYSILRNFPSAHAQILRALKMLLSKNKELSLRRFLEITPFLNKHFDIWHFCFGNIGIFGLQLQKIGILNGKFITSFHGFDISEYILKYGRRYYEILFKNGDIFLPVCDYFKSQLIELGCDKNKIIIHRMGIDLNKYNFKQKISKNYKTIKLITIGRFVEKKGIFFGIMAIKKVINKLPNIEYNIIGDGELKNEFISLINRLNIEKNVNILGLKTQPEIIDILQKSDILIAPSITAKNKDQEGIPNVLKEAMAIGIPIISTKHGGIPELIQDGLTGFLINEKDSDSLAEKIFFIINNPEITIDISNNARKYIEKNYDQTKLNNKLIEIYYNCLDR